MKFYLRDVYNRFNEYWKNHFSTIGLVGMNETCINLLGDDIASETGQEFSIRIMDFMRDKLVCFQEETGNIYNLEATPAEGTSYRLALADKKKYPNIICANETTYAENNSPFYTNSSQLSVNYTEDLFELLDLQDELQAKYTGGTVQHLYIGERIKDHQALKELIKTIALNYKLPYFSITPTFSVCPSCGYIDGEHLECPACQSECEVYSRVVGYLRPVKQWNKGKQAEYEMRKTFSV
jgi:ribonucleoside-triphosphate reductase